MNQPQPSNEKPFGAKLLVWLVLGLVILNLVLFGRFVLFSSGEDAKANPASATNSMTR